MYDAITSKIAYCYNTGVILSGSSKGVAIMNYGITQPKPAAEYTYYLEGTSDKGINSKTNDTAKKLTIDEMVLKDSYEGFSYGYTWAFKENCTPYLKAFPLSAQPVYQGDGPDVNGEIVVGSGVAAPGQYVDIPVSLKDNSGIAQFAVKLNFDNKVLVPVSVTAGKIAAGGMISTNIDEGATADLSKLTFVKMVWTKQDNMAASGVLFTVRFKVQNDISLDKTTLNITYDSDDILNQNNQPVKFSTTDGQISHFIYGDVYEDGNINGKDLLRLVQYLAKITNADLSEYELKAANVKEGDGLNVKDAVKLSKYLAGWEGIVLGSTE